MAFASGVFQTSVNPAELNQRSFAATMLRLFPNGGFPLWGLLSQQPKATAKSSTHGYFSKTLQFGVAIINNGAGYTDANTDFTIDATSGIVVGQVLLNPRTRENLRVTTVTSITAIVCSRAFGRVAAAALLDNDELIVVGSAFAEGSSRPIARGMTTVYVPNYTQIFRNAWAVTDTARASLTEQGYGNVQENRKDCSILHSVECESAIFFGQPSAPSGTPSVHATQGVYDAIDQYAPANTNTAAATTTFDQLVALTEPAFLYSTDMGNAKERIAFCGATAMKVLNDIGHAYGQITISQAETSFGMQFTKFKFYKGTINLVEHPLFNSNTNLNKLMIVMELSALRLAFLNGRDTAAEEYGGTGKNNANGVDAVGGSLTSEFAVELINPFACAVVEGLTAAAF